MSSLFQIKTHAGANKLTSHINSEALKLFFEMRKNRITAHERAHRIQHCENTICDPIPELKQNLKFVLPL